MSEPDVERLIARWAARHAPNLVARVEADALEKARARLQARLVDALVDASMAQLSAPTRSDQGTRPEPPADERPSARSGPLLWIYGVVAAALEVPPTARGVDGHPILLHRHAGVAALVSEVPAGTFAADALSARLEDLEGLEVLARAHDAVLEAAMAEGPVVPFRLCTVYSSPDRLDAMLDREALALRASLDRLDGMQEWGVKAFLRAPDPVPASAEASTAASGTEYLSRKRERREATDAEREQIDAAVTAIHARLAERSAGAVLSRPQDRRLSGRETEMVLNAAYLVPAAEADTFRLTVEEVGQRDEAGDVALELTGPWPPYNFVATPES